MNERALDKIVTVIENIQHDYENRNRVLTTTKLEGNTIVEPYLRITMADYRTLCKATKHYDDLSFHLIEGKLVR